MCRLFVVIPAAPARFDDHFESLKRFSAEHRDGWGAAQFIDGQFRTRYSVGAAHSCTDFHAFAKETFGAPLFIHLRLASVGSVTINNAHPFLSDGLMFMHNGTVQHFEQHQTVLEAQGAPFQFRGQTDSERCFALTKRLVPAGTRPDALTFARAIAKAVQTIERLCDVDPAAEPSALNFVLSDGTHTAASRNGRTLFYRESDATMIASEPTFPTSDWREVPHKHVLFFTHGKPVEVKPLEALL